MEDISTVRTSTQILQIIREVTKNVMWLYVYYIISVKHLIISYGSILKTTFHIHCLSKTMQQL